MVQHLKRHVLLLLVLLAFASLACGITAQPTPTVPVPTATATAAPTSTPLSQVSFVDHESTDLGLTFSYPDSWQLEVSENSIVVASDIELLTSQQFDREGAGAVIVIGELDLFQGETLEDALNTAVEQFNFTANDRIVEGPRLTTINGQDAITATIEGSGTDSEQTLVVLATLLRTESRVAFIAGVTLQSLVDQYRSVLDTLAQSVVLGPAPSTGRGEPLGALRYGETVLGSINSGSAASWTFIGVEGERIDVTVRPLQEDLDVSVDVHDPQGASILPAGPVDDSFGAETIRGLMLPASAQFTVIVTGFAQASGDFELAIGEAGGLTSAQAIAVTDTLNGSLELDEQDDYLFDPPDSNAITVVVNPVGDLDVVLEVLDASGAVIFQEDSSYGPEQLSFTPSANEDYILRVRGFAGAGGDYAISVQAGGVGSTGTTLTTTATLDANDEEGHDFPFTVDQNDVVQAIVSPDGDFDVVVAIYNDDTGELEETIDASFGREQVNFVAPVGGNYYFKVLGFEGQGGTYTITLNGSPAVIFELLPGDQIAAEMGDSSSIDYYIRLEPGETITVNVVPGAETDVVAEILDLDESVLSSVDDGFAGEAEQIVYTSPASQSEGVVYIVRVRDFSGETGGAFSMTLE